MGVKNRKIKEYISNNKLDIEEIMKDYTNYIYAIITKSYIDLQQEDIEEIVLDVFLTLWNNKWKLDESKSMSAYIAGITRNLIKKKCLKKKNLEDIEEYKDKLVDLSNIELTFSKNERNEKILRELEKEKQEDKEIFIAYYYEERKVKEISMIFDISESKVKSKLFRIRKRLRKILKEGGYDLNE